MTDRIFVDTNILVYALLENDNIKHDIAANLITNFIGTEIFVSTQVISELYVALIKNKLEHNVITEYIFEINENMNIQPIHFDTIEQCLSLKKKYAYSYWDSLILASSLECKCAVIYSEDMQYGQIIEKRLQIVNPFVARN